MKAFLKRAAIRVITAEARAILRKFRPKVIAITGSVGKTSAKDAIYALLADGGKVRRNEKSLNSEIGVPLTILGADNPWHSPRKWFKVIMHGLDVLSGKYDYPRTLILEIGADHPGDIKKLGSWLLPDVSVLTGVAPVHIAFFDSLDAIFEEKIQLAKHLRTEGWLVLNADDDRLRTLTQDAGENIIAYGFARGSLRAQNIQTIVENGRPAGIRFEIRRGAELPVPCTIRGVVGNAHVYALLAACGVGIAERISVATAVEKLKKYAPPPGRMRLIDGKNGATIIDDSYNSSPAAALLALDTLKQLSATRRIACLGDMRELGAHSKEAHEAVGKKAAEAADMLLTVGEESKVLADAARAANPNITIKSYGYGESERAGRELAPLLQPGDLVLVKGSQNMIRMEQCTKALMAEPARAKDLLVRQDAEWSKI